MKDIAEYKWSQNIKPLHYFHRKLKTSYNMKQEKY